MPYLIFFKTIRLCVCLSNLLHCFFTVPQEPPQPPPVLDNATTPNSVVLVFSPPPGDVTNIVNYTIQIAPVDFRNSRARRQTEAGNELDACLSSDNTTQGSFALTVDPEPSTMSVNVTNLGE